MTTPNIGNSLYQILNVARSTLFLQGELAQLTYGAFDVVAGNVRNSLDEFISIPLPVGYRPNKTTILNTRSYQKEELVARYETLAYQQLPTNGVMQLVTTIEALFSDILRTIILCFPMKLGVKRTIPLQVVLASKTIEDIHLRATDTFLNELAYKSPAEFADAVKDLISINLLECSPFHKYMEIKATRDIFIHNRGVVNETYVRKAATHARAKDGQFLPMDITYFLESYEYCIQLTEWLEDKLHQKWYSSDLEENKNLRTKELSITPEEINLSQTNQ